MNSYNGFTPAQRYKALGWLKSQYATRARVEPTKCDLCGQTAGIIEAHSEDYSEPFGFHIGEYGLCYTCHMMVHCRFKAPEKWQKYVLFILAGWQPDPTVRRNWPAFRTRYLIQEFTMPNKGSFIHEKGWQLLHFIASDLVKGFLDEQGD